MKMEYLAAFCFVAVVSIGSAIAADRSTDVPASTPQGITLIDVVKIVDSASNQYLWRRIGDAVGKPVYTFDEDAKAGKLTCVAECAKDFIPFPATKGAKAMNDWSIIKRDDGISQWAFQGKPLYYYTGIDPAGVPEAINTASLGADNPEFMDQSSKFFSPKAGWKRAAFTPEKTTVAPAEVELTSLATGNGYGFVDAISKTVSYVLRSPPKDPSKWTPIYAPSVAQPLGEFTVMTREDGTKQWAYRGSPVYTYRGDYSTSDVNGLSEGAGIEVALALRHFMPPEVKISVLDGRGPLLVTKTGMTVYTQSRQHLQYGGRETRDGYRYHYSEGKELGIKGCDDTCTKAWRPVVAPANAKEAGYWEIVARPDGTKQWAYKGSPLYTYVGDKKPGDIEGNDTHIIIYGDPEGKADLSITGGDIVGGKYVYGSGLYWHIAGLFY